MKELAQLFQSSLSPRVLLVGDVMLDHYLFGQVERISPEAPIPVLRVKSEEHRLGGAGSVATMLRALDAEPIPVAVTGDDKEGRVVRELFEARGIATGCVLTDPGRPTTVKTRVLGGTQQRHPHHMMRVDREESFPIAADLLERFLGLIEGALPEVDLVLISDYNKGVCAAEMIPRLIRLADAAGVPVVADPVRDTDYRRYAGCRCITPNRIEAGLAAGLHIETPEDGLLAAKELVSLGIESVMVTLDKDGIAWANSKGDSAHFPCRQRQVCDVTGAGDMVLSIVGFCMAAGASAEVTMMAANLAGGMEVERLGVVPLTRDELLDAIQQTDLSGDPKIVSLPRLKTQLDKARRAGRRIAMTNGCFDLLHPGHVQSLQAARSLGDCLVVAVNSDASVRKLKGPSRPIIDERNRAEMLAALSCVDFVILFDDASVARLVREIRPDVLVKAAEYSVQGVVGHEIVEEYGGEVVVVPMKGGYSTTALIERIRDEGTLFLRKAS